MPCFLAAACAIGALLAAHSPAPATRHATHHVPPDSAAEAMVLDEMRAFYRDLDARSWTPLLDHFLPAKVTARWTPPTAELAWSGLAAPAPDGAAEMSGRCALRAAVAIVGDWARVRVRRCAAGVDEAWLLRVSGQWKIVHLALASPPAA